MAYSKYIDKRPKPFWWITGFVLILPVVINVISRLISSDVVQTYFSDITSIVIDGLVCTLLLVAAILSRKISREVAIGWGILFAAQVFYLLGDTLWLVFEAVLEEPPYPSIADLFYMLFYPTFILGIIFMLPRKTPFKVVFKKALDLSIVISSITLLSIVLLIKPVAIGLQEASGIERALALAYPICDLVMVFGILTVFYFRSDQSHSGPVLSIAASMLIMIVADSIFSLDTLAGGDGSSSLLDMLYNFSNMILAFAAGFQIVVALIYPQKFKDSDWINQVRAKLFPFRNLIPYLAVIGAYIILIIFNDSPLDVDTELFIGVGYIVTLVLVRQILAIRENEYLVTKITVSMKETQLQAEDLDDLNKDLQKEIEMRRQAEMQLSYEALHDTLTGMANRALLTDRITHAIDKTEREIETDYSVLFLDMDDFKKINDVLGHSVGDLALIELSRRLSNCIRSVDTLARFGGDEFVILLENVQGPNAPVNIANRIQVELNEPFKYQDKKITLSCSIGIVRSIRKYSNCDEILRDADIAMYQAKKDGKAHYVIYDIDLMPEIELTPGNS